MYKLRNGLVGSPDTYGGLLDETQARNAQNAGMMNFGASLLAAGGPSREPTSLGQALGMAMLQGQKATQQYGQGQLQSLLLKKQLEQKPNRNMIAVAKLDGTGAEFVDENNAEGRTPFLKAGNDTPSNVVEWEFFNKLSPSDQKRYLEMKRSTQALQMVEYGGGKGILNKSTGDLRQVTSAEQEAAGAAQVAGATSAAKTSGEATATAAIDLPRVEDNSKQILALLDKIEKHPGRKTATGASSMIPVDRLAGTEARNFVSLTNQLRGKQFLEAFNSLKGGGQITEVEGKKAEDAISTIQDRGQSEEAYLEAISELRDVVNDATVRARKKAGKSPSESVTPIRTWEENGYVYRELPDGTKQRKKK
jgi:hypothetical protein